MNFQLASDLHLETGGIDELISSWEVSSKYLLLSGDITEVVRLKKSKAPDWKFFEFVSAKYEKVFWIMGNHEHYGNRIEFSAVNAQDRVIERNLNNITVLDNSVIETDDFVLFGGTLWTDMDNGNPIIKNACQMGMNDYVLIKKQDEWLEYRAICVEDTCFLHDRAMIKLNKFIQTKYDKKKIVMTHHAPSELSIDENFRYNKLSYVYYTELHDLIYGSDLLCWVHGHTHDNICYNIRNTKIECNCRGYSTDPRSKDFSPKLIDL